MWQLPGGKISFCRVGLSAHIHAQNSAFMTAHVDWLDEAGTVGEGGCVLGVGGLLLVFFPDSFLPLILYIIQNQYYSSLFATTKYTYTSYNFDDVHRQQRTS